MEHRVRDLDQIQEQDGDERGRRIGAVLLAAAALVGLTFAMGVVVGRAAEPPAQPVDPLAKLEGIAPGATPALEAQPVPKVDTASMTFPNTLRDQEDRPEVIAAVQAAAAEEALLAAGNADEAAPTPAAELAAVAPEAAAEATAAPAPATELATEELVASVPAAVAAGSGARTLPKAVRHDKLIAAAIRADEDQGPPSPRGHDGEFTLQVISYDSPESSRAFADGLRAKGHAAFVVAADIPDRGRYYRVRIGPFKNKFQAEEYRRKFESDEHMNTYVVREKPEA